MLYHFLQGRHPYLLRCFAFGLEALSTTVAVQCSVRPKGLDPFQAAKAWHLWMVQRLPWKDVWGQLRTASGGRPQRVSVANAVRRIDGQLGGHE